jgi:hypothetical protein
MTTATTMATSNLRRGSSAGREANSMLVGIIAAIVTYIVTHWAFPQMSEQNLHDLVIRFVGVAWPFFALVLIFNFYVIGACIVAAFALGRPREWSGIGHVLHWATEACPLVGLLTTFLSLLFALLTYGEAGPGQPETQAAFITQFAIAFGSSIAGGVLALVSFTLHRVLPTEVSQHG